MTEARAYRTPFASELRINGVRVTIEVRRGEPVAEILVGVRRGNGLRVNGAAVIPY